MKNGFYFLAILFWINVQAAPSVNEVRALFKKAVIEKQSCAQLIEILDGYNENNHPLFAGYKACATMVMAKHVWNPASKYSYFTSGRQLLEKSIASDPRNAELIFLRFGIQTNLPSFLNYRKDINTDKAFLISSAPYLSDPDLKAAIISYLLKSSYMNANEKKSFSLKLQTL
jgi:hypothetical protein